MKKEKWKVYLPYICMIALVAVRHSIVTRIQIYINTEMLFHRHMYWIWYAERWIDAVYYITMILLFIILCRNVKKISVAETILFFLCPSVALMLTAAIPVPPVAWPFYYFNYSIPFGAVLSGVVVSRFWKGKTAG